MVLKGSQMMWNKEHELARLHPDPSLLPLARNECVQSDRIVCRAGGALGSSDSSGPHAGWHRGWMSGGERTLGVFSSNSSWPGSLVSEVHLQIACPGVACLPFDLCYIVFLELINSHFFRVFWQDFGFVSAQGTTYREASS